MSKSKTSNNTKKLQKTSKRVTLEEFDKFILDQDFIVTEEIDGRRTFTLPAEKTHRRRTKKEFEAGAKPVSGRSHHMSNIGLSLTPELLAAAKGAAKAAGLPLTSWLRAATRLALREGMNAKYQLDTEIIITLETPMDNESPENE